MSQIETLWGDIDIVCPHCEEYVELSDLEISVTIEGKDIMRHESEGIFEIICSECQKPIKCKAQLDIGISKGNNI